jgi:ABC-type multidrug transport system fused ATPase/permease subunit
MIPLVGRLSRRGFGTTGDSTAKSLFKILATEKRHLGGAVAAVSVTSAGTVSFPYFTGKLMDGFTQATSSPEIWLDLVNENAFACVGALLLVGGGGFIRAYLLETSSEKIARNVRLDLFKSLLDKPQSFFDKSKTGDLVSRLGPDVTRVSRSIMDGAFGLRVLINATAGTVLVAKTVPLAIVPQLLGPVLVMFIGGVIYGGLVRSIARKQSEALSKSLHVADENISLIKTVKLFNGESRAISDYSRALDSVYALAQQNALASGGKVAAFVTIGGGFVLHVIYNCGMLISAGTLSLGQTAALAGYLLVCGNAYQGLVTSYGDIQKGLGAYERILALSVNDMNKSEVVRPVTFSSLSKPPSVKFENVSFTYPGTASPVLSNLDLIVPSGARQAIVGLSGSGKSSILMLLSRMYDPTSGRIMIGDEDVTSKPGSQVREKFISFVPQDAPLFNDSVERNIFYPEEVKDDKVLEELTKMARLDFVRDFANTVGERGGNLSGGERQRIAIARALSKREKPLLLLDEATSALDHESDSIVLSHLSQMKYPKTTIAVTHRMSAIEWSDRLAVVANGSVVQQGDTSELLRNPGSDLRKLLDLIEKS